MLNRRQEKSTFISIHNAGARKGLLENRNSLLRLCKLLKRENVRTRLLWSIFPENMIALVKKAT